MKIDKSEQIYLVLVPHRDTRLLLRKYSGTLLKEGFEGAYSFPWVAPLASLLRPLNPQELKNIAHAFRKSAGNCKFNTEGTETIQFPPKGNNEVLSGPRLDLSLPPDLLKGIGDPFPSIIIGTRLFQGGQNMKPLPCPPAISFSAAAVANMIWQPVSLSAKDGQDVYGYKWKIGKLSWLPKKAE